MKEAKKGNIGKDRTYIHIEITEEGIIKTETEGNTLILLGLCDIARDNVKSKMAMKPAKG